MTTIPDDMIERVARAMAASFMDRIAATAGVSFDETGVKLPHVDIWRAYARAAIEAMQPALLAERERWGGRPYSILEPKGGWRSKEQFSEVERRKLLPIAETLALLDGNAFFTVGAENEWAFSYLPEADAIYQANGGDNGWAGEASFAKPFAAAIRKGSD